MIHLYHIIYFIFDLNVYLVIQLCFIIYYSKVLSIIALTIIILFNFLLFMNLIWKAYLCYLYVFLNKVNFGFSHFAFLKLSKELHWKDILYLYGHDLCIAQLFILLFFICLCLQYQNFRGSNFLYFFLIHFL
jgi:hypothetical protein